MEFIDLAQQCAPAIDVRAMHALVKTESGFNQYAIGVVGAPLARQPRSLPEALAMTEMLERKGYNYSVGYAQVNKHNFKKYGLTRQTAFDACANIGAGAKILEECFVAARASYSNAQVGLRAALSCYYSGNFSRGFKSEPGGRLSYVDKVIGNALGQADAPRDDRLADAPAPTRLGAAWNDYSIRSRR
ncbi:lytic transglycosylase domain-containing protein [Rugamonas aquatica]|uniref:Transglycosylase SLT domain-containing protein n=1 Tax=Rugamonas aquatica TaxID=2743357 RepID=A0A6A7N7N9_9BURK|nr:lytic transglycosylase domain-containing protein [Rugamonas aquatica]MQA40757.1 transglycosylase SLT domain-containing protein [Rugamonas aquatica]